jgi:tetratricopeptide (TPR) repeat protein
MDYFEIKSKEINHQKWQAKNLNVEHFVNGDKIVEVRTKEERKNSINTDDPKGEEKLYNIFALLDSRKLLTNNFRLPTKYDWIIFKNHLKNEPENINKFSGNFEVKFWSITKVSVKEYWSFSLSDMFFDHDLARIDEFYSVRGILSDQKYIIDIEKELTNEEKVELLTNISKGDNLYKTGRIQDSIDQYLELIPRCINNSELYFKIGKAYFALENLSESRDFFEKAILLNPDNSESYYYLGLTHVVNVHGVSYAEPFFNTAIELNPTKPEYFLARAIERDKAQNKQGYLEDIENAKLETLPTKYFENKAFVLSQNGDLLGAISQYDELINRSSNHGLYYYKRGNLKIDIDNISALNDFKKAIELNPEFMNDEYFLGDFGFALHSNGNLQEALEIVSKSINIINMEGGIIPRFIYLKSKCLCDLGKFNEAKIEMDKINESYSINPLIEFLRIEILLQLSILKDALVILKKLKGHIENSENKVHLPKYYFLCGEYYLKSNNLKYAYENFKKAGDLGFNKGFEKIVINNLSQITDNTDELSTEKYHSKIKNTNFDSYPISYWTYTFFKKKKLNIIREYLNENEINKVIEKVNSSQYLKKFIENCKEKRLLPNADNFIKAISHSREFIFVFNYNKFDVACIELFDIWVREVNMKYNLCHIESLPIILEEILKKSNKLASGKS